MDRYIVKEGSDSHHSCCFDATILYVPFDGGKEYGVCECEDMDMAKRIARLLNEDEK